MPAIAGRARAKLVAGLVVAAGLTLVVLAHAHLVYVATTTQPDCVPHTRAADGAGTPHAARSAC